MFCVSSLSLSLSLYNERQMVAKKLSIQYQRLQVQISFIVDNIRKDVF